jgi:formylglycine-generating enzyme required for sulfatase activity
VPPGYSQPPYGYSQPPPAQSRLPIYIFLSLLTVIVGLGVYFLIDYLIAAKQQLANEGGQPAAATAGLTEEQKKAMAELAEAQKKLEAERARVAAYLEKEEKRLEKQRRQIEEAEKKDEARLAAMKPKADESEKDFAARRAEEKRKAEQRRRQAEQRLAEQRKRAEQRRQAEQRRLAAAKKRAEQARREAERRRKAEAAAERRRRAAAERRAEAERRRRAAAEKRAAADKAKAADESDAADATSRPMLEEIPLPGSPQPEPAAGGSGTPEVEEPADESKPAEVEKKVAKVVEPEPIEKKDAGSCPRGMIYIPGGTAWIGSAPNDPMRNFGELTLHKEEVQPFCIDRYEYPNAPGREPRTGVTWGMARRLCRKRGNRRFPYGNTWNAERCNTEDAAGNDRSVGAAGAFKGCRSPFGVRDMSGNVSEWTATRYKSGAAARTHKGGSATRPNWASRCATRSSLSPGARKDDLGFRCCTEPK